MSPGTGVPIAPSRPSGALIYASRVEGDAIGPGRALPPAFVRVSPAFSEKPRRDAVPPKAVRWR